MPAILEEITSTGQEGGRKRERERESEREAGGRDGEKGVLLVYN